MAKNIRVIGGYKCGCTYGPIWKKDRLKYCGVHGDNIANEYEIPSDLAYLCAKCGQVASSHPRPTCAEYVTPNR